MSRLRVVMPVLNALAMTVESITKLVMNTATELAFVIVDNGSDEDPEPLRRVVEHLGIPMDIIRNPAGTSIYKALNQGLGDADQAIVCCSDVFPLHGWLQPCDAAIRADPAVVWASPEEKTGPYHWRTGWMLLQQGLLPQYEVAREFKSSVSLVNWKAIRETVGVFDESMELVFGDTDLLERLNAAGLQAACVKGAYCQHLGSQSRRLTGVAIDVDREIRDAMAFVEKWKDRPEVLARHPGIEFYRPENAAHIRAQKARKWETE